MSATFTELVAKVGRCPARYMLDRWPRYRCGECQGYSSHVIVATYTKAYGAKKRNQLCQKCYWKLAA